MCFKLHKHFVKCYKLWCSVLALSKLQEKSRLLTNKLMMEISYFTVD